MNIFWRGMVVVALTVITVLACHFSPEANLDGDESSGVVMKLPLFVLGYEGMTVDKDPRESELLPDDTQIERYRYVDFFTEKSITCSIVLAGQDSRSIHRPEICLPSQGWRIKGRYPHDFEVKGETIRATVLVVGRDEQLPSGEKVERLALNIYWFVGKDMTTHSHVERVWKTSWDNVFRNVNHRWAYVTVNATIPSSLDPKLDDEEATMKSVEEFIAELVPKFQKRFMD